MFIGFLSESERESWLNSLRRTVSEAKESRSEQSCCEPLGPDFCEAWLIGSALMTRSIEPHVG
ncbi:hypothetical protein SynMITS9220_01978 [Synechococcus sp. MIT S9220]|nr:hypothetical protein SynMITS9220_01978 [Synechococcus sp. MIT S9220]